MHLGLILIIKSFLFSLEGLRHSVSLETGARRSSTQTGKGTNAQAYSYSYSTVLWRVLSVQAVLYLYCLLLSCSC